MLDQFKQIVIDLETEDRSGFVVGWADTNMCVLYLENNTCNIVGVSYATVITDDDVRAQKVYAGVKNSAGVDARLLLKAAVIDKTVNDLKVAINKIEFMEKKDKVI